ncbi:MAG: tetratricopeptide repeat protein [Planctomycetota bacterium]|nr:tetratricopeptide repeat protein [Planctomycetota bacterium]
MSCPDLKELDRYLSGELDLRGRAGVEHHLASCDSCKRSLSELRAHAVALEGIRHAWHGLSKADAEEDAPQPEIPGYEILRTLHHGGQGVVYVARQQSTRRLVAVKLLLLGRYASKRQRRRFEREIDLTATLDHPNIVTVFDSGVTDDGRMYLVMRYVEGQSLDEHGADRTGSVEETLALFTEIGEAVNYAHQRGVIHRDLKPNNILIDGDGVPHLLDFGLAKYRDAMEEAQRSMQTQAGEFVGTLAYAAPEQVGGDPFAVDVRSDVYSLGVILFEMLTSAHPYPVDGRLADVIRNIGEAEPARASSIRRDVDDELDTIIGKTLSKEKERRYQSVADLLRDLHRYRSGRPIEAKADSTWYVLRKTLRRHRVPVSAAAAVMVVLIVATIVSIGFWRQAVTDRRQSVEARDDLRLALGQAELEASKVAAINEFLVGMLDSVQPLRQGKDVMMSHVLDEAAASIDESFADQPLIEAELRTTIGNSFRAIGLLDEAEPHLSRAVEIHRDLLGEEDPRTLMSVLSLAITYHDQGRYGEAEPLLRATTERCRRILGEDHPDTLRARNALGLSFFMQGRFAEAEPLWEQVLERRRRTLGEDDLETLNSMNNICWLYLQQGRYDEAEVTARRAYEQECGALGEEHPLTLTALYHLATVYHRQGRYAEAEPAYAEALHTQRRVLGDDHPDTLFTSVGLGWLYLELGRYEKAERFHLQELETARRVLGDEHPGTLQYMNGLAVVYDRQGRDDEAEDLHQRILDVRRRVLGEEHPGTLASMNNLAALYYEQGRFEEVEPLWLKTLEIRRRVLGEDHPETLNSVSNLGLLCHQQKRYDEAEALHVRALEGRRTVLGPTHRSTVSSVVNLAAVYRDSERFESAARELQRGHEDCITSLGAGHEDTLRVVRALAELHEAWGKPEEAARYRALLTESERGATSSTGEAPQ